MKKTKTISPGGPTGMAPPDALQPLPNIATSASESASVRVSNFRGKLATEDLKRYELYVSSQTRSDIKHIAKIEGLSSGVAAEALIKLGIESYHRHPVLPGAAVSAEPYQLSSSFPPSPSSTGAELAKSDQFCALPVISAAPEFNALSIGKREIEGAVRFGAAAAAPVASFMMPAFRAASMSPGFLMASALPGLQKGLGAYSERSEVSNTAAKAHASSAASVTHNLIAAALKRKPRKD